MSAMREDLTMTNDLVTWLRQQLDDYEREAIQAAIDPLGAVIARLEAEAHQAQAEGREEAGALLWAATYVKERMPGPMLHDPARVLVRIAADRRILNRLAADAAFDMPAAKAQAASHDEWYLIVTARDVLKLLALPYADRPGYRDEWKP